MNSDPTSVATSLFEQLEKAWNSGDGAAFGAPFADVTHFVDIRGEHHSGDGTLIGHGHQAIFDTIYRGSTVRYTVVDARELAPTCVLAHVSAVLDAPSGPLQGTHASRITGVILDEGERWAITAFHNTLVTG